MHKKPLSEDHFELMLTFMDTVQSQIMCPDLFLSQRQLIWEVLVLSFISQSLKNFSLIFTVKKGHWMFPSGYRALLRDHLTINIYNRREVLMLLRSHLTSAVI